MNKEKNIKKTLLTILIIILLTITIYIGSAYLLWFIIGFFFAGPFHVIYGANGPIPSSISIFEFMFCTDQLPDTIILIISLVGSIFCACKLDKMK